MTYLSANNIKNTSISELKEFLSFMSLLDTVNEYEGIHSQTHEFNYMGDGMMTVTVDASDEKIYLKITHENEVMINLELEYSEDEMDFVAKNSITISNVEYPSIDSWRAFEFLSEIYSSLQQDYMVGVEV